MASNSREIERIDNPAKALIGIRKGSFYDEADLDLFQDAINDAWRQLRLARLVRRENEVSVRIDLGLAVLELAERGIRIRKSLANYAVVDYNRKIRSSGQSPQ